MCGKTTISRSGKTGAAFGSLGSTLGSTVLLASSAIGMLLPGSPAYSDRLPQLGKAFD